MKFEHTDNPNEYVPKLGGHCPWGPIQSLTERARGIISVATPSHGGVWLSVARVAEMRKKSPLFLTPSEFFPMSNDALCCWFEEDCEVGRVFLAFPEVFGWEAAQDAMRMFSSSFLQKTHGTIPTDVCPGCGKFAHATESDDRGFHAWCRPEMRRARAWQRFGGPTHHWENLPAETQMLLPSDDGESVLLARAGGETFGEAWGVEAAEKPCALGDACTTDYPCERHGRSDCDPFNDFSSEQTT